MTQIDRAEKRGFLSGLRRVMRGESNIDFIGRSRLWLIVTATVVGISLVSLAFRQLNLGLEFEGGTALTVPIRNEAGPEEIEGALEPFELGEFDVQILTRDDDRRARIRSKRIAPDKLLEVRAALAKAVGQVDANGDPRSDEVSIDDVGASWGRQVSNKAIRALVVFLVLVTLYISFRFEPKMAASALAALFHDLIVTAGVYSVIGFEVTPATVIAFLTLMGFSLYDTVVVFDRVRENTVLLTGAERVSYGAMVNRSMNEVLVRSINTSLSSVLPVAGLLFVGVFLFGAVTLKDLALAMTVGALVSTYSSIFVASPLLAWLKEREPRFSAMRDRTTAGGAAMSARAGGAARRARREPEPQPEPEPDLEREPAPEREARAPHPVRRPASTPRPRRRKRGGRAKRR